MGLRKQREGWFVFENIMGLRIREAADLKLKGIGKITKKRN